MIAALRRWRDETGDLHALRAVRVALGLLLLQGALRAGRELRAGYFGDAFHWPLLPEALVLSKGGYTALVIAQGLAAALVVTGFRARPALFASALMAAYVPMCDRLQFHHNRWALACYALLLSFTPCERVTPEAPARGPLWAARLAQLQVTIIYLASGGSKLLDPDWRSGRVLMARVALFGGQAVSAGVPGAFIEWLGEPSASRALATLAIATELLLAVGLWPRRTRAFALWWGVWFHLTIEATSSVEGFTWLTLAMYALFARPDTRARQFVYDASRPYGRVLATALTWTDWLARFERVERPPNAAQPGIVVVNRDGREATGARALAEAARCVPLLFPLWVPLALFATLRRGR